jgi:uncharacterized protein YwqG
MFWIILEIFGYHLQHRTTHLSWTASNTQFQKKNSFNLIYWSSMTCEYQQIEHSIWTLKQESLYCCYTDFPISIYIILMKQTCCINKPQIKRKLQDRPANIIQGSISVGCFYTTIKTQYVNTMWNSTFHAKIIVYWLSLFHQLYYHWPFHNFLLNIRI